MQITLHNGCVNVMAGCVNPITQMTQMGCGIKRCGLTSKLCLPSMNYIAGGASPNVEISELLAGIRYKYRMHWVSRRIYTEFAEVAQGYKIAVSEKTDCKIV